MSTSSSVVPRTSHSVSNSSSSRAFSAIAIESLCYSFICLCLILTVAFSSAVDQWPVHAMKYVLSAAMFFVALRIADRISHPFLSILVRTASVTLLFSFLFGAVHSLQHIIVPGWMDTELIRFETKFTGVESTLFFQDHMSVVLTEIMMFAYVIYVPLLPFISLFCFWSAGTKASFDYLFNLAYAYIVCYLGFMVYPIASPLYHQRDLYTIPFEGGVFTWFGEWMRHNVHYAGGSLPSPHCAAATVMLVMMWRYNRKIFWPLLAVVLVLYVSTVYGRYHYVSDGVIGIIAGVFVLKSSPALSRVLDRLHARVVKPKRNS